MRFDLVTAGRGQTNARDFEEILDLIGKIRKEVGIEVCCSLGFLTDEQARRLKKAGISRLHCNIETAPSYFHEVCTTHSMEDKEKTLLPPRRRASGSAAEVLSVWGRRWIRGWRWRFN